MKAVGSCGSTGRRRLLLIEGIRQAIEGE